MFYKFYINLLCLILDHSENGTERRQARKQKRVAVNNFAVTAGKPIAFIG